MKKFNESPDVVGGQDKIVGNPYTSTALKGQRNPNWGDDDSVTFALFNNFNLYSLDPLATHGDLYQNLTLVTNKSNDPNVAKNIKLVVDSLSIKHSGELSEEDKNKIKNILAIDGNDRLAFLRQMPNVIQGRLWTESKIISFWNDLVYIAARKNDIIKFIDLIKGYPEEYQYEIKDKLYNYNQFLSGKYNDDTKFDPTAVHTLPPDKKGEALKKMGVAPKQPVPLQFKQMLQGESFRNWLQKQEN
jgi:hypothetical protein